MRICGGPLCELEILEDAVCGCGYDNSGTVAILEMEQAKELAVEGAAIGGYAGAVLEREAREEAILAEETAFFG